MNTDIGGRDRPDPTGTWRLTLDISAASWLTWYATPARPGIAPQPGPDDRGCRAGINGRRVLVGDPA